MLLTAVIGPFSNGASGNDVVYGILVLFCGFNVSFFPNLFFPLNTLFFPLVSLFFCLSSTQGKLVSWQCGDVILFLVAHLFALILTPCMLIGFPKCIFVPHVSSAPFNTAGFVACGGT